MAPHSFVICNHSCPHSKETMMTSSRADALKLCYIFPYPPCAGIEEHVNTTSFHPLCNNGCEARNGTRFVDVGIDNVELQYWLPTLLLHAVCPPGYDASGAPLHRSSIVPGSWDEEPSMEEEQEQEGKSTHMDSMHYHLF
jgi:hypothetical protein